MYRARDGCGAPLGLELAKVNAPIATICMITLISLTTNKKMP
jgi:hypothetical protein